MNVTCGKAYKFADEMVSYKIPCRLILFLIGVRVPGLSLRAAELGFNPNLLTEGV